MINITEIKYDLAAVTPQGDRLHLNDFYRSLSLEEQPEELAVSLKMEIHNQQVDGQWLHQLLPLGGQVYLWADWGEGQVEVFRGNIRQWFYRTDPLGHLNLEAYDMLYQLRSKDHRSYAPGTKARVILEDIASFWKIPLGTVEGPEAELGKKIFRNRSVAGMMTEVLGEAQKRGAGEFILRAREGQADIIRAGGNTVIYHFESGAGVMNIDDQQDIRELITRVKVFGKERTEKVPPVVAVEDGATEFGILQEVLYLDEFDTPAAARKAAEEIIRERGEPRKKRKVTAPDLPFIRKGDKVHIQAGTLDGYYIVSGVRHEIDRQTMIMEVKDL
ncbi:MAG: XkdQ/YqbQ family protein [Peptococcaceae bacterium]